MTRPLVGRARELAILRAAVADIRTRGRLVLVTGEAGIGKSRLADETAALMEAAGGRALFGRAWEAGSAPAFWPWIQVLRALEDAGHAADEELDGHDDVRRGPLGVLLAGKTEGMAPDRFEVFDAFARVLARRARAQPLLVVLDDLHVADRATLLLLSFLAQHLRAMPVLVVGTLREVEARLTPDRGDLLAKIARGADVLPLARLGRDDVALLVAGPSDVVDAVFAKTEGNPLFVDEVVRLIETRGDSGRAIPDGVRAAIREHLARVSDACRAVLEVASVFGREMGSHVVAAVAGVELESALAMLSEAERAGLVIPAGDRAWRFAHVLTRDTLYDDLDPPRRSALHRRAATALASTTTAGAAPLAEIARHYAESGSVADAVDYARRASRAAVATLAFEEAVPPLASAVAIADDDLLRGALLVECGEARIRAGDVDGGWRDCRAAADIARALASADLLARAALAFGTHFTFGRVHPEMVAILEEATAALSQSSMSTPLRARVLARLAGAMQPSRDPRVPMARAREAIEVARAVGDDDTSIAVLVGAGSALQDIADPGERTPLNLELLALATARGDRTLMLRARLRLAFDKLETGDVAGADAEVRAYERIAVAFRHPRHHFPSTMWGAMRALMQGELAEHARLVAEARSLAVDDRGAEMCLGCHAFLAARARGDLTESRALVDGARWFFDEVPAFAAQLEATLRLDGGDRDGAALALARVSTEEHVASLPTLLRGLLPEAAAAVGSADLQARIYDGLLPSAGRTTVWSMTGMFCAGPVARGLGVLASALGRHDDAERHFAHAETVARAGGMQPILARLELDRAAALDRAGRRDSARTVPHVRDKNDEATPSAPLTVQVVRDGELWAVSGAGESCRLKDSVGMRMLKKLIDNAGRELHALELAGDNVVVEGDAGPALDDRAKAAYRARLRELRAEEEEAVAWNDVERQARAADELERLTSELSRALGLGGRDRKQGSVAERARVNAQRRISDAIKRIAETCPKLGRHLSVTVRTGIFCWYDPASRKRPTATE